MKKLNRARFKLICLIAIQFAFLFRAIWQLYCGNYWFGIIGVTINGLAIPYEIYLIIQDGLFGKELTDLAKEYDRNVLLLEEAHEYFNELLLETEKINKPNENK